MFCDKAPFNREAVIIQGNNEIDVFLPCLVETKRPDAIRSARNNPRVRPKLVVYILPRIMTHPYGAEVHEWFRVILYHNYFVALEFVSPTSQEV